VSTLIAIADANDEVTTFMEDMMKAMVAACMFMAFLSMIARGIHSVETSHRTELPFHKSATGQIFYTSVLLAMTTILLMKYG
jgi:organic hydroperoxide reductase OsmC/OhrA